MAQLRLQLGAIRFRRCRDCATGGILDKGDDVGALAIRSGDDLLAQFAFHAAHGARQMFDSMAGVAHTIDGRVKDVAHVIDQARDRRVRADSVAPAAGRAVLGDPLRVLVTDAGHVAERGRYGRHPAETGEGIGKHVVALTPGVERPRLFPEAVDVGGGIGTDGQTLEHGRQGLDLQQSGVGLFGVDDVGGDLDELIVATTHDPQVVFDHTGALAAELVLQLILDGGKQLLFGEARLRHHRRRLEEGALEGDALHAQLQLRIGRLLAGDLEAVDGEDADLVLTNRVLVARGNISPQLGRRRAVALNDEDATFLQTCNGVGVLHDLRVRRQHDVDVVILTVYADRLGRGRQVVSRGLTLLLRAVLGVRLDVIAEQVEEGHRQILARGDRAPAADGMEPRRDAACRHQVGVLAAVQGQILHVRVGLEDLFLMGPLFRCAWIVTDKVDGQVEEFLAFALGEHVLHRGDQPFRLQVTAAHAEGAGVQWRCVGELRVDGVIGVRQVAVLTA